MESATAASLLLLSPLLIFVALASAAWLIFATARSLDVERSVLVHLPVERVWDSVRRFPSLHARHGKARRLGSVDEWVLKRGDGESPGSIWCARGCWGDGPYWAELEIVRVAEGRELSISLLRDSLGTHRGLREHLGSLTLEAVSPGTTKLTWQLRAKLRGPRLRLLSILARPRLQARLFDQGLRSIKTGLEREAERPSVPATDEEAARKVMHPGHEPDDVPPPPIDRSPEQTL